jgi:hypothetical protein
VFSGRQPIWIQRWSVCVQRGRGSVGAGLRRPAAGSRHRVAAGYAGLGALTGDGRGSGPARCRPVRGRQAWARGGCRRAGGSGAVLARPNPAAGGAHAGRFDRGPMAAADLAHAVGGDAGAPFPVESDVATTIADADAHLAPPGADRFRCGLARRHGDGSRCARGRPNRPLSVIRFRPLCPSRVGSPRSRAE